MNKEINIENAKASQFKQLLDFFKTPISLFLIVFLLPAVLLQYKYLKTIKQYAPYRESLYLPSGKLVKPLAFGFDNALADFLWLRSIQSFGGQFTGQRDYTAVFNLFDVITDLDPKFLDAFIFGNLVIGDEAGEQEKALKLLDKGIEKNPLDYRLAYEALYICNWSLNDKDRAKKYAVLALRDKTCPDFISRILNTLEMETGRYQIAFDRFLQQYLETYSPNPELVTNIYKSKLEDVVNQWQVDILLDAAKKFKEANKRDVATLAELQQSGFIETYEIYDLFNVFALADDLYNQGKNLPKMLEEIKKRSLYKSNKIPPAPYDDTQLYVIVPSLKTEDPKFIISGHQMKAMLKESVLPSFRRKIQEYFDKYKIYPPTIFDIYGEPIKLDEPFGGTWLYNPATGEFKSSTFQDL